MFGQSIPASWSMTTIETVADVKGGKRLPKGKKLLDEPTDHPYIRVTDFENASVNTQSLKYLDDETYDAIKNYTISDKDLYISIAGTIGLVGTIPKHLSGANLTENAAKIAEVTGVLNPYLSFVLNSNGAIEQFKDKATSSGQPKLALFRIKDCSFPLPPIAEQKVIAEKLDKLLAKVDSIKARLDAVPNTLKRFRQSVLAAAVSGQLTEEWRLKNGIHWEELTLGKLAEVKGGKRLPKGEQLIEDNTGFPYIRAGQLKQGTVIKTDDARSKQLYITKEVQAQISRYTVSENDLYITIVGASIGDAGVIPSESNGANLTENAAKLTDFKKPIVSKFLAYWLRSQPLQDLIRLEIKSGAQGKLALKRIKELPAPYTNIKEQTEIVRRVEQLFAYADKVEAEVNAAQERVNKLTQSILAKAFRGELTAKWREKNPELISGDNSAEALLAKIKAEREQLKPKKKA
ncbi:hypothetical protein A3733_16175, partial [Pseudoalteromonas shioyasakiensis]